MARTSKVPTPQEHARLWGRMSFADRRRVMKAINKGQGMPDRREARVAVGVARQQQRYWRWAWVIGPVMGLVLIPDWVSVVVASAAGTAAMGAISWRRSRNAVAAEQANLDRLGVRR
jgi:hypothetical protein